MAEAEKISSWTNGKPFVATTEHCKMSWDCGRDGKYFRCALCGHRFAVGETVRWQFTNDTPGAGGNPFVCTKCDTGRESIISEILRRRAALKADQWWWFLPKRENG